MKQAAEPSPVASAASAARRAATVEFRHVTKVYGSPDGRDRRGVPSGLGDESQGAVSDLSFLVPAGSICVLVGPSGCGKTTSLKMVNRLIEPTSGEILVDGVGVTTRDVTELRRQIGYVIQQVGLFPHLTIGENVAVVPKLLGWSDAQQRERAETLLALVGLDPARYRARYPSQLSGGERQRVGVARALAADPLVMLMDEPFGAVDPIVRERLQNEFLRLQDELAKTILFVTHDIDEAIKMGDLVAVMAEGGRLAQFGRPADILARPASEFVARFVGSDRGLKRLSLTRLSEIDLLPVEATVAPGTTVPASAVAGPLVLRDDVSLRDALSLLLDADATFGLVVDADGRALGRVTVDMIAARLRATSGPGSGSRS